MGTQGSTRPQGSWAISPVSRNLNIQGHLDVKQVLILSELRGHLPLGISQLTVQLLNSILGRQIRRSPAIQYLALSPRSAGATLLSHLVGTKPQPVKISLCSCAVIEKSGAKVSA